MASDLSQWLQSPLVAGGLKLKKAFQVIAPIDQLCDWAAARPPPLRKMYESLSVLNLMRAVARSTLARTSRAMAEASSLAASAAARELATQ